MKAVPANSTISGKTMALMKNSNHGNGVRAKKSLGQNFCIDDRIPAEIVKRLGADENSLVWEIGPGKGALTRLLAKTGAGLQLFEIDERMRPILEKHFPQAQIVWGDFLEIKVADLPETGQRRLLVTGNLPYYCGTPILRRFLEDGPAAARLVFLLQHEVASKAAARENTSDYGYLSVHTAFFAEAEVGSVFGPASFDPPPKVRSAILEIRPLTLSSAERNRRLGALKMISVIFSQRRKMALPLLKRQFPATDWATRFAALKIDEKARPENIGPMLLLELFAPEGSAA